MSMIADEGNVSLACIESFFLQVLGVTLGDLMGKVLEGLDDRVQEKRDKSRYQLVGKRSRTIETVLGQPVTFKRRYYWDMETGNYVFLLDELVSLDAMTRTSPLLHDLMVSAGVDSTSYRAAAESLARVIGSRITSHESIRRYVIKAGEIADSIDEHLIEQADGKRKVKVLFMAADGMWVHLQQNKKRSAEERMVTVFEGWEPRRGSSQEFSLTESSMWSSHEQGEDWWDMASRWVYGKYDIDDETIVAICGDRASWIRRGIEYFPARNVLYQVDRFHLTKDIRRILGKDSDVAEKVLSLVDQDPTGDLFMRSLFEARPHVVGSKRKELDGLIADLSPIRECVCDYRIRLRALGVDTSGLRGLGVAESEVNKVSNRMKKVGRSWSPRGLKGIMGVQRARFSGNLGRVLDTMENAAKTPSITREDVSNVADRAMKMVFEALPHQGGFHPRIMDYGRVGSGGMSHLFHALLNGA